jgi:acyl carrier protein
MLERLQNIITEFVDVDKSLIVPEAKFIEDLGFNSYDFMSFLGEVENEFDVEAEESEVINLRTVQEVMDYIEKLQNK